MDTKNFKDKGEYIDHLYTKYFGERDTSAFPHSIMEEFDMRNVAENAVYRDVHDILVGSEPLSDYDSFLDLITLEGIGLLKSHSFEKSDKIQDKYEKLYDALIKYSMEQDENNQDVGNTEPEEKNNKDDTSDINELKFITFLDILYDHENRRIIKLMESLSEKCRLLASNVDSMDDSGVAKAMFEIARLLDEARDTRHMAPERMMKEAGLILLQVKMNVINDEALEKMTSRL